MSLSIGNDNFSLATLDENGPMDILPGINDEERLIMLKKGVDYSEQ